MADLTSSGCSALHEPPGHRIDLPAADERCIRGGEVFLYGGEGRGDEGRGSAPAPRKGLRPLTHGLRRFTAQREGG